VIVLATIAIAKAHIAGLLDTSVVIDLDLLTREELPAVPEICVITLAELGVGIHLTSDPAERAVRQERLQRAESQFVPLPFDVPAAQRFTYLVGLTVASGRSSRPRRLDLMIGAVASVHGLPLYTRNPRDFMGLERALTVIPV
jgi:predicted nucleic acid-binding protein